jgi:hypothetical protein
MRNVIPYMQAKKIVISNTTQYRDGDKTGMKHIKANIIAKKTIFRSFDFIFINDLATTNYPGWFE